jgi:hypothetical protein
VKERINKELEFLRQRYPDLEYREDGQWLRIPEYTLPSGWAPSTPDVVFQIPTNFPGSPPYGFYVPAGLRFKGQAPGNYTEPASTNPPFAGPWGFFSWSIEGWRPTAAPDPIRGYSLVSWVQGFGNRFQEGV